MPGEAKETKIPLIGIGLGLALYLVRALAFPGASGFIRTLGSVLIAALISTVVLIIAALIVSTLLKVSFGDPRTAILKFAAASLLSGAVSSYVSPYIGIFIGLFVFLGIVMYLFELEVPYALALGAAYFVIMLITLFVLAFIAASKMEIR